MDISTPLQRLLVIEHEGGGAKKFFLQYEKLADFCYACGRLNHVEKNFFSTDMAGEWFTSLGNGCAIHTGAIPRTFLIKGIVCP